MGIHAIFRQMSDPTLSSMSLASFTARAARHLALRSREHREIVIKGFDDATKRCRQAADGSVHSFFFSRFWRKCSSGIFSETT